MRIFAVCVVFWVVGCVTVQEQCSRYHDPGSTSWSDCVQRLNAQRMQGLQNANRAWNSGGGSGGSSSGKETHCVAKPAGGYHCYEQ